MSIFKKIAIPVDNAVNMHRERGIFSRSTLTKEEIDLLRANIRKENLDIKLSDIDIAKYKCNHKTPEGILALKITNDPDIVRCSICGETFSIRNYTDVEIAANINVIIDVLQQIKTLGYTLPKEVFTDYMIVLPYLKKLATLYETEKINFKETYSDIEKDMETMPSTFAVDTEKGHYNSKIRKFIYDNIINELE